MKRRPIKAKIVSNSTGCEGRQGSFHETSERPYHNINEAISVQDEGRKKNKKFKCEGCGRYRVMASASIVQLYEVGSA